MGRGLPSLKFGFGRRPKVFGWSVAMAEARITGAWLMSVALPKNPIVPPASLPSSSLFCRSGDGGYGSSHLRNAAPALRHPRRKNISMIFEDTSASALNSLTGAKESSNVSSVRTAASNSAAVKTGKLPSLDKLKEGFINFKKHYLNDPDLVARLAEGQEPPYMIITCSDSRVDPCTVLSLGLGQAFVVRNIGNMVPPYTSSSNLSSASAIEYAVLHLKVKHLVIMGHSRCGAIKALMGIKEDGSNRFSDFIEDWVLVSKDAAKKVKHMHPNASFEEQCAHCEKEVVNLSMLHCLSFPFVREKMATGELTLHGAYYDFVNLEFSTWCLDLSSLYELETVQ